MNRPPASRLIRTYDDVVNAIRDSQHPVLRFGDRIVELERFAEPGMRARVLDVVVDRESDAMVKLLVDYDEFAEANARFERNDFYLNGGPFGKAREVGVYEPREWLTFYCATQLDEYARVEHDASLAIYFAFRASGSTLPYIRWLERQLRSTLESTLPYAS